MKEEEPKRIRSQASIRELKTFRDGHLWRSIYDYLKDRYDGSLHKLKTTTDRDFVMRLQGAIEVAEDLLDLPDKMIEWAEEDQTLEEGEE